MGAAACPLLHALNSARLIAGPAVAPHHQERSADACILPITPQRSTAQHDVLDRDPAPAAAPEIASQPSCLQVAYPDGHPEARLCAADGADRTEDGWGPAKSTWELITHRSKMQLFSPAVRCHPCCAVLCCEQGPAPWQRLCRSALPTQQQLTFCAEASFAGGVSVSPFVSEWKGRVGDPPAYLIVSGGKQHRSWGPMRQPGGQ